MVMRTGSDFDRQYPGQTAVDNLLFSNQGAFVPAIANIYLAGIKVIEGILDGWDSTFEAGVKRKSNLFFPQRTVLTQVNSFQLHWRRLRYSWRSSNVRAWCHKPRAAKEDEEKSIGRQI
jgi:hypothetical protein